MKPKVLTSRTSLTSAVVKTGDRHSNWWCWSAESKTNVTAMNQKFGSCTWGAVCFLHNFWHSFGSHCTGVTNENDKFDLIYNGKKGFAMLLMTSLRQYCLTLNH